jgi:hypothetical protein
MSKSPPISNVPTLFIASVPVALAVEFDAAEAWPTSKSSNTSTKVVFSIVNIPVPVAVAPVPVAVLPKSMSPAPAFPTRTFVALLMVTVPSLVTVNGVTPLK